MEKWEQCLEKYSVLAEKQEKVFIKLGKTVNLLSVEHVNKSKVSKDEKNTLSELLTKSSGDIIVGVNETLERFKKQQEAKVEIAQAEKLIKIKNSIPTKDLYSQKLFYITCQSNTGISYEEINWLYWMGYIPHTKINRRGDPLFNKDTWFSTDLVIRKAREKHGIGINKRFQPSKGTTPYWNMQQWLELGYCTYYGSAIINSVISRVDKDLDLLKLTGEDRRATGRIMSQQIYKKEGSVLATKILSNLSYLDTTLVEYYRDTLALLAHEAFPTHQLIKSVKSQKWRQWYLLYGERATQISVSHPIKINTYHDKHKAESYRSLAFRLDFILSLAEGRKYKNGSDIISNFQHKKDSTQPCRICAKMFNPRRKIDVTCGSKECIRENKNRSKRKDLDQKLEFLS
jgi:hypothetical protein